MAKGQIAWRPLWEKTDEEGEVLDRYSTSDQPATTAEGYRLVWYHSLRKAEQDAVVRSGQIERTLKQLAALREKLRSPRTRYRQEAKVAAAVAAILENCAAGRVDRNGSPTANRGDVSPGPSRATDQGYPLREEGDHAV